MRLFIDKNPASDEYTGNTIGFFIRNYCLIGLYFWHLENSYQSGIVLFHHLLGIWWGSDAT